MLEAVDISQRSQQRQRAAGVDSRRHHEHLHPQIASAKPQQGAVQLGDSSLQLFQQVQIPLESATA